MMLLQPLKLAREKLGLADDCSEEVLRRAYRKGILEHPPDRDPDGFRAIREAYELLRNPVRPMRERLRHPLPLTSPAEMTETGPSVSTRTLTELVRVLAADWDTEAWLTEFENSKQQPVRKARDRNANQ